VRDPLDEQAELLLAAPERLLRQLPLGQVAGDLGVADQFPARLADRVDHHMRPEAAAVLAHPPAFALEATLAGGDAQGFVREPGLPLLLGVEPGEMLTHDLVGRVTLEALRSG